MKKLFLFGFCLLNAYFFTACNAMLAELSKKSFQGSQQDSQSAWEEDFSQSTQVQNLPQNSQNLSQSSVAAKLLSVQSKWKNTPYRLGGTKIGGADCSGFTQTVFKENFNTQIPRTTTTQMQGGKKISKNELKSGDLLFFKTGHGPNGLHVGIYVENDDFIHLSTRGGVRKVSLKLKYWANKFIGARRYM